MGDALLQLQRRHGNRYVQRLVGHARRHTDVGADTSARVGNALRGSGSRTVGDVLRRDSDEVMAGEQVRSVLRSGGAPLDPSFRDRAESFLGADLSQVRVHTGAVAAESARAVQAHAYTSGVHVVFGQGMYDTRSTAGQNRLVHELTHVVQQQRGSVAGTRGAGGLSLSDPSDRFEREAGRSGAAFASAATQQREEHGRHRGVVNREAPAPQHCTGVASRSASAPVPIQRFKIPSGGASFSSGAYGEGYLYMKGTPKLSLQPRSGGSGGYDVVESHVTVFPRSKGSDQADNFHVTFVLTSNEGKAGSGLARKQEEAEKAAKAKEEATKAAHLKGSLAERTSARFDTSGGAWRRGGGISVSKDISIHFHGDEKGLYRNDFEAKFGRRSDFHTLGNYRKLHGVAESIAGSFIDKYLKE
ncbi:MAG: eCIS core domain-containing protein [Pseudonocardiales bacterium]